MQKRSLFTRVGTAAVALALLAGCSATTDTAEAEDSHINIYLYSKFTDLSPLNPFSGGNQLVMSLIFDNLVTVDQENEFTPRLAESWDISDDAKTYTFHLREGLKWSDGEPFTAEDVKFTYDLIADPAVASSQSGRLKGIEGYADFQSGAADSLAGITAVDDSTFEIQLSEPNGAFLGQIGAGSMFYILPEHILADAPRADLLVNEWLKAPDVGMGPYQIEKIVPDAEVVLTKNPEFYKDVNIDTVYLKQVTSDVATAQLSTGEMDIVQISPLDADLLKETTGVSLASNRGGGALTLLFNFENPIYQDVNVRQAFVHAINRQGILDSVYNGYGSIVNTMVLSEWAIPKDLDEYAYDPEKAKKMLADAGWDASTEVLIHTGPSDTSRIKLAEIVAQNLQEIGVNGKVDIIDPGRSSELLSTPSFDLYVSGGGNFIDPSLITLRFFCDGLYPAGANVTHYCNPEFDAAMKQGNELSVQEDRAPFYQEAVRIENHDVPNIWMVLNDSLFATSDRVQGFTAHSDFTNFLVGIEDWSVKG